MDEWATTPSWLRGAAVAASLAGVPPERAGTGLRPDDAAALARAMRALVVPGDRAATARAIARARAGLASRAGVAASDDGALGALGALVVASMLRGLLPAERAAMARAIHPSLLRAAAAVAPSAVACDAPALGALLARLARGLGRAPDAAEVGWLTLAGLGRDDSRAPAAIHATLRSARARGASEQVAVACAPFAAAAGSAVRDV